VEQSEWWRRRLEKRQWGRGPWGQGPIGGDGQPPDLQEMLKRGQDNVKQVMRGGGVPGPQLFLVAIVAGAIIAWQAFTFRVQPDEVGGVLQLSHGRGGRDASTASNQE